jgi:hypothetical protein
MKLVTPDLSALLGISMDPVVHPSLGWNFTTALKGDLQTDLTSATAVSILGQVVKVASLQVSVDLLLRLFSRLIRAQVGSLSPAGIRTSLSSEVSCMDLDSFSDSVSEFFTRRRESPMFLWVREGHIQSALM